MVKKISAGDILECPLCAVEVPMSGDEEVGDQVFCTYCQSPLQLKKTKTDDLYLEEDF
ncbi:MAG: hypothetical protein HZB84_02425 [Deltaproteobacteria bacterium]|nr:hypothetical protein [Deltaproteobacteria bacterium]